jgi:hypothetical protein
VLFDHFDSDGSGDVDIREFQQAVCGKRRMPKAFLAAGVFLLCVFTILTMHFVYTLLNNAPCLSAGEVPGARC